MKILVTGASGFVGQHLLRDLSSHSVVGTAHRGAKEKLRPLEISDAAAVGDLVRETRFEVCFHLAGIASVDVFTENPQGSFRVNTEGWLNVLEAFKKFAPGALMVLVSSAQVYGNVSAGALPITEDASLKPENVYSVSKCTCEWLAKSYWENFGLRVLILRPFNHAGPGQSASFVCSSLAKQIAQIEAGLTEPVIRAGNLASRRDFTDVRDITRAYAMAIDRCKEGIPYNICSGRAVAIEEILERLLKLAGIAKRVKIESVHKRDSDPEVFYGNYEKFGQATGWAPQIPLEKTLQDTLDFWREQVRSKKGASTRAPV